MIYDLEAGDVGLLVIDVQQEYFKTDGPAAFPSAELILPNVNRLIQSFRDAEKAIVFVKHMNRADGSDVGRMGDFSDPDDQDAFIEGTPEVEFLPELDFRADDIVVVKRRYSAFLGTDLESILRTLGVNSVVVTGLMTSFCCETTARDAHGHDYEVLFVSDANEGPDLQDAEGNIVDHTAVLSNTITALSAGFAEVVTTDEVIARLSVEQRPLD
jgi:nicotinamidase-related amidase